MTKPVDMTEARPAFKVTRGWVLRLLGSVVILAGLFWYLPMEDVAAGFSNVSLSVFAAVLALFLIGHAFAAGKWWMLLERGFNYLAALRAHFAGLAANLCLPGVAGGDVVRAGLVAKSVELAKLTAASLSDRLIDMLALALVSAAGLLMLQNGAGDAALITQVLGLFVAALIGVFYILPLVLPRIYQALPYLPAKGLALKISGEFGKLGKRPVMVVSALLLSVGIQAAFVGLFIWLASSAGVEAPAGAWFFAWPLAKILAVLPISLGGIGLREATLAGLMAPFGAAAAPVVAASLIWQAVLIVAGLIGAAAWVLTGRRATTEMPIGQRKEV